MRPLGSSRWMSPRQGKWSLSRAHNSTVTGSARRSIFQSSLEDRLRFGAPGQVSWLSDRPTPRAFPASRPVARAGFVPDYSDGVAADSHSLPCALSSTLGANDAQTVAESPRARNARQRREVE